MIYLAILGGFGIFWLGYAFGAVNGANKVLSIIESEWQRTGEVGR